MSLLQRNDYTNKARRKSFSLKKKTWVELKHFLLNSCSIEWSVCKRRNDEEQASGLELEPFLNVKPLNENNPTETGMVSTY